MAEEEPTLDQWLEKKKKLGEADAVADVEILKALRESWDKACEQKRCDLGAMDAIKVAKALNMDLVELLAKLGEEKK